MTSRARPRGPAPSSPSSLSARPSRSTGCRWLLLLVLFCLVISLLSFASSAQQESSQRLSSGARATSERAESQPEEIVIGPQAQQLRRLQSGVLATPSHIPFRNFAILGNSTSKTPQVFAAGLQQQHARQSFLLPSSAMSSSQSEQRKTAGLLEKICIGTSNRVSIQLGANSSPGPSSNSNSNSQNNNQNANSQTNKSDHYQNLVERYQNCTYVIGNLEITWLSRGQDLSFLESIREITGYLLIAHVGVDKIRMPNLQIIRGRDLFKLNEEHHGRHRHHHHLDHLDHLRHHQLAGDGNPGGTLEEFAMILIENELRQLELPNLREILAGSVGSYNNRNLCLGKVNWDEIINWPMYRSVFVYDGTVPECPECDDSCGGNCWGPGPEQCQKFSKSICHQACAGGRCFGPLQNECCHSYCAGGCTGSNYTHCLACKNYYDDGSCVQECPSMSRYNPSTFSWDENPDGKYAFGATCVRKCPENMLRDSGACVRTCPPNKRSLNGECVTCGGPCPKNCTGVEVVHSGNIHQLINCTVIEGSITILDESFTGYTEKLPSASLATGANTSSNEGLAGGAPGSESNSSTTTTAAASTSPASTASGAATSAANSNSNSNNNNNNNNNNSLVRHKPMHPSRLEVFKTLREITGYLRIKANHPEFKDLSYFTNLKTIEGRQATDTFHALSITRTSLVSLNLRSLRKIGVGKITIEDNPELCFADTIDWQQIDIKSDKLTIRNNADGAQCRARGLQCNEQCARDGCWGPGPDECLSCNNYKVDNYCVNNCNSTDSLLGFTSYEDSTEARTCRRCHAECSDGCTGTEARHCHRCKNVKDGPYCVPECPSHKYNNNGTCEECDKSCGPDGCTGASNRLGEGGCNSCAKAIIKPVSQALAYAAPLVGADGVGVQLAQLQAQQAVEVECIRAEESCPDGYYQEYVLGSSATLDGGALKSSSGRPVCRKCLDRCKRCIGMGTHRTVCECAKYVAGEQCEDTCPRDYYVDEESRQCLKCSPECNGCNGPTEADCLSCRVYRIYYEAPVLLGTAGYTTVQQQQQQADYVEASLSTNNSIAATSRLRFNCTAQCPPDKPHRISESNMLDPYCSEDPGGFHDHIESSLVVSLGSSSLMLMLVVVSAALMVCLSVHRFQSEKDKKLKKLALQMSSNEDVEPLTPSHMKPNLAPLRSIKETELRKGNELGSGFGGTVYQGLWTPEGQQEPRPVAIKVLRDNGQSNMNKEFLDEAFIMASVHHQNLVRLLAVCMTPRHLMLVTQLMPFGCLLDYVKKNKDIISSKNLLEWGKQIANGMAYLEERRMVHRDLALRNVLLRTPKLALISDFGLAKFLEVDQSEYHSGEGRLPIKWLAPECFRKRKFTHKSDVWAFGVTVWELVTFGERPFEEYETRDVPLAIEKGARLQQPAHVSAEVYKVMYACWFYNPEDRPDFKQLAQSFVKFARDPRRFIICEKDRAEFCKKEAKLTFDHNNSITISDEDDDEFAANSDVDEEEDEEEDYERGSQTAAEENLPTTISSFSQQVTPTALGHQPDLTPSTHNRLNNIFAFNPHDRHRRSRSSESSSQSEQAILPISSKQLAVVAGEIGNEMAKHQHHLLDHANTITSPHQHHHNHHHRPLRQELHLGPKAVTATLIDANNNNINLATANNNRSTNNRPNNARPSNRHPKNSVTSCWSVRHTSVSSNSLGQRSEQPTDVYDYLLPSPCTDEHGNTFGPYFATNPSTNYSDQNSKTMPRNIGASRGQIINNNPPLSAGLINSADVSNEEYFLTQANYVNNHVGIDEYHQSRHPMHHTHHQQQHLSPRFSSSSEDIPQSLV